MPRKNNKPILPSPKPSVPKPSAPKPSAPKPSAQQAIRNIAIVVTNARMTGQEHQQLQQDLALIVQRCEVADKLEK